MTAYQLFIDIPIGLLTCLTYLVLSAKAYRIARGTRLSEHRHWLAWSITSSGIQFVGITLSGLSGFLYLVGVTFLAAPATIVSLVGGLAALYSMVLCYLTLKRSLRDEPAGNK